MLHDASDVVCSFNLSVLSFEFHRRLTPRQLLLRIWTTMVTDVVLICPSVQPQNYVGTDTENPNWTLLMKSPTLIRVRMPTHINPQNDFYALGALQSSVVTFLSIWLGVVYTLMHLVCRHNHHDAKEWLLLRSLASGLDARCVRRVIRLLIPY